MGESGQEGESSREGEQVRTEDSRAKVAHVARLLLRAARQATLATQSGGQPFAGLVTPAIAHDASLLLLLSDLSEHTRHLRADPRCAVMTVGPAPDLNPQTAPRVTVLGPAVIDDSAELRARYLAVHPYAALYADFGDFHLWRVRPQSAAFVGGFARAFRFSDVEFAPEPNSVAALDAVEAEIVAHCNADHPDAMELLFAAQAPASSVVLPDRTAVMVGVDPDGCDIRRGEIVRHVAWSQPCASADAVRRELILLARSARAAGASTRDATTGQ